MKPLAPAGEPGVTARSRPSAGHVALAAAAVWLILSGLLHAMTGLIALSLFSIAPLIAATVADERRTAVVAGAAAALAAGAVWWHGLLGDGAYRTRIAAACVISAMAVVVAGIRCRREERLARMTAIATACQLALLPPLPPEMTGITIAARYRSATRDASVGGDLYEIIPCACRKSHPCRLSSMPVLVEDAAEAVPSVDVKLGGGVRLGDGCRQCAQRPGVGDP
jgi:phosphoserine phosphatase RsbU/P